MWVEVVCAAVLLYGLGSGWRNGLIKEICSTLGFLAGAAVAWYCHIHYRLAIVPTLALCVLVPVALGFAASFASLIVNHIFVIGTLNRILGAIVGCVKYGLLAGFVMLVIDNVKEWRGLTL